MTDQFKAVCFDIDGTMGDTFPLVVPLFAQIYGPYAGRVLSGADVKAYFGLNEAGIAMKFAGDRWQQAAEDFYAAYARELKAQHIQLFPGIMELLKALKQSGVLLLLATGKGPECCQITLDHWGLQDMFAATCCGGPDRLNKAEHLKGLMAQFHLAPADLCYIGDALSDFTACAAVGVRCLSALWQSDAQDRDELVRLNGPYCFDSVQACAAYVYSNCPALQEYQTAGYFVKSIAKTVN